jgi:hypothetical protein
MSIGMFGKEQQTVVPRARPVCGGRTAIRTYSRLFEVKISVPNREGSTGDPPVPTGDPARRAGSSCVVLTPDGTEATLRIHRDGARHRNAPLPPETKAKPAQSRRVKPSQAFELYLAVGRSLLRRPRIAVLRFSALLRPLRCLFFEMPARRRSLRGWVPSTASNTA